MNLGKKIYFITLFLFLSIPRLSATYYVDSKLGNDLNSGLSVHEAWKSLYKLNNFKFSSSDTILLKSNCIWREELILSSSGTVDDLIVIGSYGYGKLPKIMGSELPSNIDEIGPNLWQAQIVNSAGWLWFIKEDGKIIWGSKKENINELIKNYDFKIDSNSVLFYCDEQLIKNGIKLEASVRDFGIISGWYDLAGNNIKIENLEICFTKNANIRQIGGSSWIINNIVSHHSGAIDESEGQGIQIEGEDNLISSCKIYENGQHGIFISAFGNFIVKNNIIQKNTIFNNYHTGIDLMNDGGSKNSLSNTIIRRNLIYDDSNFIGNEIGIQTLGYSNGYVKNITIHHNILKDIKGIGISIAANSDSIFIHNNTIFESKSACVSISNEDGFTELFNNIAINNSYYAVLFLHETHNKILDYNIWFTKPNNSTKNIYSSNYYYDQIKEYQNKFGFDIHGSFLDPKVNIIDESIVELKGESICVDSGKNLNYTHDYLENEINNSLDIGAVEYKK